MYEVDEAVQVLYDEMIIMNQLVNKNHYQHGNSKIFRYIKTIIRRMRMVLKEHIVATVARSSEVIKKSRINKITSGEVNEMEKLVDRQKAILEVGYEIIQNSIKALQKTADGIRLKTFISLYSVTYAITSRVLNCWVCVCVEIFQDYLKLFEKIQQIGLNHPKYKEKLETIIRLNTLSTEIHEYFTNIINPTSQKTLGKFDEDMKEDKPLPLRLDATMVNQDSMIVDNSSSNSSLIIENEAHGRNDNEDRNIVEFSIELESKNQTVYRNVKENEFDPSTSNNLTDWDTIHQVPTAEIQDIKLKEDSKQFLKTKKRKKIVDDIDDIFHRLI